MSAYGSQPAYSPQPGYNAAYAPPGQFPPQHGFDQQQGQYPPQQGFDQQQTYSQYGAVPGYQPPSSASPPPNLTPSPGPKEGEAVFGGQQQQQQPLYQQHQQQQAPHNAMELPAINPVGNETNRAELG
ncbi:hypothetical protein G7Z17_g13178 [Cylindrodendrum hubeiense]|uniref:Uncharacterized protein n=1 Tax=Cylindrodendrum hubeiense TaxID=595255 RepID=A0A9P5L8H9_9HYPO|nr:hypothetical protein G7Z17_g13178 [Cylindrodendrum hubeiense]